MINSTIKSDTDNKDGGSSVDKQLRNVGSVPSSAAAAAPSVPLTGDVVSAADQAASSDFPSGPAQVPIKIFSRVWSGSGDS